MVDALDVAFPRANHADFEYILMLAAAQATHQALTPEDFDNAEGVDAFVAILTMLADKDDATIYVTPEWRRVVISARRAAPNRDGKRTWPWGAGERHWKWKATGEATQIQAISLTPAPMP